MKLSCQTTCGRSQSDQKPLFSGALRGQLKTGATGIMNRIGLDYSLDERPVLMRSNFQGGFHCGLLISTVTQPVHSLHPCQLHHSSSYSAICQICMESQHARDSENVECYCKLLLMTEMRHAVVTTDGTISDSWNGPWLIEFYVTFILFLPFCDPFIPWG